MGHCHRYTGRCYRIVRGTIVAIDTHIVDKSTGKSAKLLFDRALAVAPPELETTYNALLGVDDTPVEIVPPKANSYFCITSVILAGNKSIDPNTDALVTIYEASPTDTSTSINDLFTVPVARSEHLVLSGLMIAATETSHIMGTTSDDDVYVVLIGFYVD